MARKILIWSFGLASLLPIAVAAIWTVGIWIEVAFGASPIVSKKFGLTAWLVLLALGTALLAVYIRHALRNPQITEEMRIIWPLILVVGNGFVMPFYWWIYMRPGRKPDLLDPLRTGRLRA
ncbi:MAG TPA: hypothetical protein VNT22_10250 [Baekduia sp.]|nr:hypothetical protein [Baekduia sp.]